MHMGECPTCSLKTEHLTQHYHRKPGHKPDSWPESPTCGERFQTKQAVSTHRSRIHDENVVGVEVECSICGGKTRKERADVERNEYHTCSDKCLSELRKTVYSGENHAAYKGAKVTKECPLCGDKNTRFKGSIEGGFCDHECYGEWLSKHNYGEAHHQYKSDKKNKRLYETKRWKVTAAKALERDNGECQFCFTDDQLVVHHIHPVNDGGAKYDINNLVTLCRSCHMKWEGLYLRPDTR